MSRPKKGEPGYASYRERENARQREGRSGWASRGFGVRREWREANPERAKELQREFRARRKVARANEWLCDIAQMLADYLRRADAKEATA